MRAKEYECFVLKIQRLENLCRVLHDERNILYKKIKEAQCPGEKKEEEEEEEEESGQEDILGNKAGASFSITGQAAAELSVANENVMKDIAAAFMVTHHMEVPTLATNPVSGEELHDRQASTSPNCPLEPAQPSPRQPDPGKPAMHPAASVANAGDCGGDTAEKPEQDHPATQLLLDTNMEGID